MARYKYLYTAYIQTDGHYSHFTLKIFKQTPYSQEEMCSLEWQGDRSNCHWYAGRIHIERASAPTHLYSVGTMLETLFGDRDFSIYANPEEVIQKMVAKGWKEAIYDPRFSSYVPLAEVPGSDYHKWGDTEHCVSVVARDQAEAIVLIHAKMDEYRYVESKEKWIAAGEQVTLEYTGTRVDKTGVWEMLESPAWYKKPEERGYA
jgi:hypothetical protein